MMEMLDDAVASYQTSLHYDPESAQVHFNLGSSYGALRQFEAAERHYKEAIVLKEANVPAHMCLGEIYIETEEYE